MCGRYSSRQCGDFTKLDNVFPWFITIACIEKGKNILITKSPLMKPLLKMALDLKWT